MSIEQALIAHTEALNRLCDVLSNTQFTPLAAAPAAVVQEQKQEPAKAKTKAKPSAVLQEITAALEPVQPPAEAQPEAKKTPMIEIPVQEKPKGIVPPVKNVTPLCGDQTTPVVYEDIKAAVQVLLRLEGGQNEVLKVLKDFKVANARELHVSEWERFLRRIEAVTAQLLQA